MPSPWLIQWKPVLSKTSLMEMGGNNLPCLPPRESLGIQGLEWLCGVTLFHGICLMAGIRGISSSYCLCGTGRVCLPPLLAGHSSGTCGWSLAWPPQGSSLSRRAVRHPRVSKVAPRGYQAPTGVLAAAVAQPWHGSANTSSPAPSIAELLPPSIFIYFFSF